MKNLSLKEMIVLNGGGSDPDGCSGCSSGRALREAISSFFAAWAGSGNLSGTAGMYK
ncbi:hypothetical protein [uncultured Maribacter sp.]|uniref:hypothetical protein n=1 Tax=uncultured Maribacter sp. TaxID=431308 RepID=UPI0030EDC628